MKRAVAALAFIPTAGCFATREATTVRIRETLEVVEMSPQSLAEQPPQGPGASRARVIMNDGRDYLVVPNSLFRSPEGAILGRSLAHGDLSLDVAQVHAIHLEHEAVVELSRETKDTTRLTTVGVVGLVVIISALAVPAVAYGAASLLGGLR